MNKVEALYQIIIAIKNVAASIDNLAHVVKSQNLTQPPTVVDFSKVVWLDATGEYILIWYADGTGQILHVEGQIRTLSTVAQNGKTLYKLTNGRELLFDRSISKLVIDNA